MSDPSFITWPFFAPRHAVMLDRLDGWAQANVAGLVDHHDIDGSCRKLVAALGEAGFLDIAAPPADQAFDVRSLCLARERLAWHAGLADFAFAMQGLGTGPISPVRHAPAEGGVPAPGGGRQAHRRLRALRSRSRIRCRGDGDDGAGRTVHDHYVIDGEKTWISNGGIADHYVVFARTGEAPGAKGISAFMVDADTPGLEIAGRIDVIAPHPLAACPFRELPRAGEQPDRRSGRRVQGRDGNA